MIARIWTGRVPLDKADAYQMRMSATAIPDYRSVPGNRGAWCLRRDDADTSTFIMLTFWDSLAAIESFAGRPATVAKYYQFDPDFLLEMPATAQHFEIADNESAGR